MSYLESEYDDLDKYINFYGTIYYCKKDTKISHNPYGPAIIWKDGSKFYYIEDRLHRLDGPAVTFVGGNHEYWINGERFGKEEFEYHPERLKLLNKKHLICLI